MIARLPSARMASIAAVLLLASAPRASAESVTLYFDHSTNSSATITVNGGSPTAIVPGPYYWKTTTGPINAGNAVTTFCAELTEFVDASNASTYQTTTLAGLPTVGTQIKADYISELYGRYYDTAWNNPSFGGSTAATAFQFALWELLYDGPSALNLGSGNFTVSDPTAAIAAAKTMLLGNGTTITGLTGNASAFSARFPNSTLIGLTDPTAGVVSVNSLLPPKRIQDQIALVTKPVPAPPGAVLAGIGVLALLGRSSWRRKIAQV